MKPLHPIILATIFLSSCILSSCKKKEEAFNIKERTLKPSTEVVLTPPVKGEKEEEPTMIDQSKEMALDAKKQISETLGDLNIGSLEDLTPETLGKAKDLIGDNETIQNTIDSLKNSSLEIPDEIGEIAEKLKDKSSSIDINKEIEKLKDNPQVQDILDQLLNN